MPLLILETLHLALDEGWLSSDGEVWRCENQAALFGSLGEGSATRRRLESLSQYVIELLNWFPGLKTGLGACGPRPEGRIGPDVF